MYPLAGKELRRRVERDSLATFLDGLAGSERIPERHRRAYVNADRHVAQRSLGGFSAQADRVFDSDVVLAERAHQRPVSADPERRVDPPAKRLAPQIARHPEEPPALRVDDDEDVGGRLPVAPIRDRYDRRHRDHFAPGVTRTSSGPTGR